MTHAEITEKVLAAYRQGYLDGASDRPAVPAPQPQPQAALPMGAAVDDATFEAYNQAIANLMGFDGTPQESVEQTLMRTKQR